MNSRSAIVRVVFLLATTLCAAAKDHPEIDRDIAEWRKLKVETAHYRQPPKSWYVIEEPRLGASFALPCKADPSRDTEQGELFVTWKCSIGGRSYQAVVFTMDNPAKHGFTYEQWLSATSLGHIEGALDQARSEGVDAAPLPEYRVLYQGAAGREWTIYRTRTAGVYRLLPGNGIGVILQMWGEPGAAETAHRFFDTLKLAKSP